MTVQQLIDYLRTLPMNAKVEENSKGMPIDSIWIHTGQKRVILDNSSNDPKIPAPGWNKIN